MSTFNILELADLGGVNRRTVRYYVQRGLIPPPTGVGRGRHYTQEHLDVLRRVKRLQEKGARLEEIAEGKGDSELATSHPRSPAATLLGAGFTQRGWRRIEVAAGVELHVEDRRDLDATGLARAVAALRAALTAKRGGPDGNP